MNSVTSFIDSFNKCPTSLHFIDFCRTTLKGKEFEELKEGEKWDIIPNKFFMVRDDRSLIAFNSTDLNSGLIIACHSDSPCMKTKPKTYISRTGVDQARIAPYGNGQWTTWLDRDFKIAGKVIYRSSGTTKTALFESQNAIAISPSLAVHLNRTSGLSPSINLENNMNPIVNLTKSSVIKNPVHCQALLEEIAKSVHIDVNNIVDFDLTFIDANPTKLVGIKEDLIMGSRLESLSSAVPSILSFASAPAPSAGFNAFVVFDSAEIGSNTRYGAKSNLISSVFSRIGVPNGATSCVALDGFPASNPNSFTVSDTSLGKGIFAFSDDEHLRSSANALEININNYSSIPLMNSISPIIAGQLGIKCSEIGIPVLGNHSIRETIAVSDLIALSRFISELFAQRA